MHPVETHAQLGALHPVGRMGEIVDIVDAILYLDSASFVTERPSMSTAGRARATERPPAGPRPTRQRSE